MHKRVELKFSHLPCSLCRLWDTGAAPWPRLFLISSCSVALPLPHIVGREEKDGVSAACKRRMAIRGEEDEGRPPAAASRDEEEEDEIARKKVGEFSWGTAADGETSAPKVESEYGRRRRCCVWRGRGDRGTEYGGGGLRIRRGRALVGPKPLGISGVFQFQF
jgi:hypothetical protein